jgi:hypothetical protein
VVLLGDLNGTMDDRAFADITSQMHSAQDAAGDGFGFSWPAKFPVARIDQILVRGMQPEGTGRWRPESAGEHRAAPGPEPPPPMHPRGYWRVTWHLVGRSSIPNN